MIKVLFVCYGNICRSPTALGVFSRLIKEQNLSDLFDIDSAATHGYHTGEPPDTRAQQAAKRHGISIEHLRARQVSLQDFAYFDYLLVMDQYNLEQLSILCPPQYQHKIHKFLEFASQTGEEDVPDPYEGIGLEGFEYVYQLIEAASLGFLKYLRDQQLIGT